MAEVVKKKTEDKYDTSKIKSTKKKSTKEVSKKTSTTNKKENNDSKKSKEKKGLITRFRIFCSGVKGEFKRVHWTDKKSMVKYSIATIFFIIFCSLFFYLIDIIFALVQSLFN